MITLDELEIRRITKKERPKAQARVLDALGVPFKAHPDGTLVVSRAAAEQALGASIPEAPEHKAPDLYEVNVEGVLRHGKATANH